MPGQGNERASFLTSRQVIFTKDTVYCIPVAVREIGEGTQIVLGEVVCLRAWQNMNRWERPIYNPENKEQHMHTNKKRIDIVITWKQG